MLYVHSTAKLAKAARISLQQAPNPEALHWFDCWYANLVRINQSSSYILVTNARCLYSVLIPQPAENFAYFGAIAEFTRRLENRLNSLDVDAKTIAALTQRHTQYTSCKTASRRVLGSMNEMAFHLRWMIEEKPDITVEALEDVLNEMPFKILGYAVPLENFESLLASTTV